MNINDYLVWRGDLPICKNYPFNEVDGLILARLSYLPFDKINFKEGDTLEVVSHKMKKLIDDDYKIIDDKDLIFNLGNSLRFKDLYITDFILNKDRKAERQFGAITIHLGKEIYVSYIGTDNSIIGWKEDFNLSFMKNLPAQLEGVKYLNDVLTKYKGKVRIGGHSKGGNVAIYSSLYVDKKYKNRINYVYNFDGPGFYDEIIFNGHSDILSKINTYIPQDSVIGRILKHRWEITVVNSSNKGLYQHDIYSWGIIKDKIIRNDGVTGSSEFTNETINEWLLNTSPENRKIFVDGVFEMLYSSESESFRELSKTWTKEIPNMMGAYKDISKDDRKVISKMIKEFIKASSDVFKKNSKVKIEELKDNFFDKK